MIKGANGVYYQSGLGVEDKSRPMQKRRYDGIYRAVVINVFPTDDDKNIPAKEVVCDVVLLRTLIPLPTVPVAAWVGANDGKIWNPKPTTGTISGEPLVLPRVFSKRGTREDDPIRVDDYNGDMVLIRFIEGDGEFPMIVDRITHGQSRRRVVAGDGWNNVDPTGAAQRGKPELNEMFQRFAGTEFRINKIGDVLLDLIGANHLIEDPAEVPIPLLGGEVRVRIKDGVKLVVSAGPLQQDVFEIVFDPDGGFLPPAGATQQYVRGTTFIASLSSLVDDLIIAFGLLVTASASPGLGPLTTGFTDIVDALTAFKATLVDPLDPPLSNFIRGD